jgi:hypothetical protein
MLPHQSIQPGRFGAVPFVVERDAIGRPLGLSAEGLHARLPRL